MVDAVVERHIVLVEGKLAEAEEGSAFVDGGHVGFCQYLTGVFQACLLVLAVVGDLHQFLQVVASTLFGEILMAELHSLQEAFLSLLIVLFLKVDVGFGVKGDISAPEAVLIDGIFLDLVGYLLSFRIVLMRGFVDGLIAPRFVVHTFDAFLLTFVLQGFGDFHELLSVGCTDQSEHFCLQLRQTCVFNSHSWNTCQAA